MLFSFVGCKDNGGQTNGLVPEYPPYEEPVTPGGNQQTQPEDPGTTPVDPTPGKDDKEPDDQEPDDPGPQNPDDQNPDEKEPDDQEPDDKPVEKFSYVESKSAILENLDPIFQYYKAMNTLRGSTIELQDIYVETDNTHTTIGFILTGTTPTKSDFLQYGTVTLPAQAGYDLKAASTTGLKIDAQHIESKCVYQFLRNDASKYAESITKMQKTLFENYDNALWLGWSGTNGPQYDYHSLVCYDGNQIQEKHVNIKNDGLSLVFPTGAVDKYFDKGDYTVVSDATVSIDLPQNTLQMLIEKESQEAEQQ